MPIHVDLNNVLQALSIIAILAGWMHFIIIKPIKTVLYSIEKQIEKLNIQVEKSQEERTYFFEQIGRLDESLRSVHHRVDELREECRARTPQ